MKKQKISTIVFATIIAAISLTVAYAIVCPTIYLSKELQSSLNVSVDDAGRLLYSAKRYALVAFIGVFMFFATFLLDRVKQISLKICSALKNNYITLVKHLMGFVTAALLGIISETVFRAFVGTDSTGSSFNTASLLSFCALYAFIAIIITERKSFGTNPEKAVALMILVLGIFIIFAQPFSHNSWDIDSHYTWAVHNSFFKTAYYTQADYGVEKVSTLVFITNTTDVAAKTLTQSVEMKANILAIPETMVSAMPVSFSIAHLPSGIAIALSRLFGANFEIRYYCGEIANLLVYTTTCYFAVKKLKSGKMIMSVVAMIPTSIFIASNYSYDAWVTGFSLLGTAYFISDLEQQDKPIRLVDTVVMSVAFMLAAMPKLVYVMLFVLPLFMRKKNWGEKGKQKYYITVISLLLITVVLFALKSLTAVGSAGDTRGGNVNPGGQISYILGNPIGYAIMLIKFLLTYISPKVSHLYITNFAYLGVIQKISYFYLGLMVVCAFTDKESCNKFKGMNFIRIIVILCQAALLVMIATALYISFTPVGAGTVNGCQWRYIIPLLAPVLLTVANPGIRIFKTKTVYNFAIFAILSAIGLYTVYTLVAVPMM